MTEGSQPNIRGREILLIAPRVPPYGGMGLQAELLIELLNKDGVSATFLASNLPFPKPLRFLERIRGLRPFLRSAMFTWHLWRMLRHAEVVHILACSGLYFFVVVYSAVILSRVRRKRVILNYHGGLADQFLRGYGRFTKPIFRMAHVVTAPSEFLVQVITKRTGVPVQFVPNVIPFAAFRYRERKQVGPKMLVTRHLEKLYGIELVIRAFGAVQVRYPEATLSIAGTGSQESYLRDLVLTSQLKNVVFLGYVAHSDLPAIYDESDILINASHADNFPGSLVEASAAGLVVISTAVGGIPFMYENERSALLVAPGDWSALAAAAVRVVEYPDLAMRLTREAHQQCQRYNWTNVRPSLYRVYGFDLPRNNTHTPVGVETASPALVVTAGKQLRQQASVEE